MDKGDRVPLIPHQRNDSEDSENANDNGEKIAHRKNLPIKKCFIFCLILLILIFFIIFTTQRGEEFQEIWDSVEFNPKLYRPQAFFLRPEIVQNLECEEWFQPLRNISSDNKKHNNATKIIKRITWKTPDDLPMECEDIFGRHYFPADPLSEAEAKFPISFAKVVYKDYYFIEAELAKTYSSQNFYCFSMDKKSSPIFHEQIRNLSTCFPNVFYSKKEFSLDSAGHFMNMAHYECLKILNKFNWKYVILLQNHDFAIKTNAEMVQILEWFNGTNDVELRKVPGGRVNTKLNYTFEELKIFRNASRNNQTFNGFPPKLNFAKGYVEASLSKAMVDFMINDLDLTELLIRLNKNGFGVDEVLIQTLLATEALNAPGGMTHRCIDTSGGNGHYTRKSSWYGDRCLSGIQRHSMCIYGMEDLIMFPKLPHLFANKMTQDVDFGAIVCWNERMFNRTYKDEKVDPTKTLNATLYLEHSPVRFNRERALPGFDPAKFKC